MLLIGGAALRVTDVAEVARADAPVGLAPAAHAAIAASHASLLRLLDAGAAMYGVTTGLGAAVDTVMPAYDPAHQRRIPLARAVGVGPRASREAVRAMMLARVAGLAYGASGASPPMVDALLALLQRGVTPAVPTIGSIGEADLAPLAHIAAVLAGSGEAEWGGALMPAADALARAGIVPPEWAAKDGHALVCSNAGSVGPAALLIVDAAQVLGACLAAAALSMEGFRASLAPFAPLTAGLRPAPGAAPAAAALLALLDGGDLIRPGAARRLQDPLSFRLLASVHGAAADTLDRARALVELELNSSDDNPAIIHGQTLPSGNFDPTALALALETLGQALLRVGLCAAERALRLMSPSVNDLPRFLAAPGQNGFATVQKTLSALLGRMQHAAAPMSALALPVADQVEDYASQAPAIVAKTAGLLDDLRLVAAAELMIAARACDLRRPMRLGLGTAAIHAAVRLEIEPLDADRPTGPDIERLAEAIRAGRFDR